MKFAAPDKMQSPVASLHRAESFLDRSNGGAVMLTIMQHLHDFQKYSIYNRTCGMWAIIWHYCLQGFQH